MIRTFSRRVAVVAVAASVIVACSSDEQAASPSTLGATSAPSVASTQPTGSTVPTGSTEPPESTAPPESTEPTVVASTEPEPVAVGSWQAIPGGDDCACSDGSPFELWERSADPTKVVLFLEGGGACFDAATCGPASPIFTKNLTLGQQPGSSGVFDPANPDNPLAEYSFVYVPYCTGDVHLGNRVNQYSDTVTINHGGFGNASKGLDTVTANYPDVQQLVVAGSSAGAIPAPAFAGLAADVLPDADIVAFSDASGAYPDVAELNVTIGSQWGVYSNLPDWPVNEGLSPEQWSIPGLSVQSGRQHPDITFARFDHARDAVQTFFAGLLEVDTADLLGLIDQTEGQIEAAGVPVASYVAPGDAHTILGNDDVYRLEVEGVRLIDWLATLLGGAAPDDVRCTDC